MTTPSTEDNTDNPDNPELTGDGEINPRDRDRGAVQRFTDRLTTVFSTSSNARTFTDQERHRIHRNTIGSLSDGEGRLLRIEPAPDGQSITGAQELFETLSALAETGAFGVRNTSPVMSFEIWMTNDEITFNMFVPNDSVEHTVMTQLDAQYPAATVEHVWEATEVRSFLNRQLETGEYTGAAEVPLPDSHIPVPPVSTAGYIAGKTFSMEHSRVHPIKTGYNAEDGKTIRKQDDPDMKKNDPYKSVISSMIADDRNHFVLQVVFSPAKSGWANKWWWYYHPLKTSIKNVEEDYNPGDEHITSESDADVGKTKSEYLDDIEDRSENPGFRAEIRVIGYGENETTIEQGVQNIGNAVQSSFGGKVQSPVGNAVNGDALLNTLDMVVSRTITPSRAPWRAYNPDMYLSSSETAMFAHLPNNDVESSLISWQRQPVGNQIPGGAEGIGDKRAVTPDFPLHQKPRRIPPDPDRVDDERDTTADADATDTTDVHGGGGDESSGDGELTVTAEHTATAEPQGVDEDTTTAAAQTADDTSTSDDATPSVTADDTDGYDANDFEWLDHVAGTVQYCENQSRWVSAKLYGAGAVTAVFGVAVLLYSVIEWSLAEAAIGTGMVVVGVGVAWYEVIRRRNRWFVVTDKRVCLKTGILSLGVNDIPHESIRRVKLNKNFIEKRLGIGTIDVVTSGEDEVEIQFTYVKNPFELKRTIQTLTGPGTGDTGNES